MGNILGSAIQPSSSAGYNWYNTADTAGGTEKAISGALGNAALNYNQGGASSTFTGLPGYQGPLSPDNMGNLDTANQVWAGGSPYLSYLQGYADPTNNYFANGQAGNQFATNMSNIQQFGGIGGAPTQNMGLAAQYGGQAGPGTSAMANLLQFGTASPGMTGVNNIAQTGVTGSWGNPLQALATSPQTSAAASMLSPYAANANASANNLLMGTTPGVAGLQSQAGNRGLDLLTQTALGQGAGGNVSQLPAWQAMVAAERQPIEQGRAALQAQFDVGDNRFSTAFGQSAANYEEQTAATQNAALTGAMTASMQQGLQNQLQAQAQLSGQGLAASQQLGQQGYGGAQALFGGGLGTAQQLAGLSGGAATQLSNLGYGANTLLNQNSLTGAGSLFQGQTNAMNQLFGNQNNTLGQFMNYGAGQQQLGANASNMLGNQFTNYINTGAGLGQQTYVNQQSALNNNYQNWLYTQPQNNPFVQMMYGASQNFVTPTMPGYQPGVLGSILGAAGTLGGAAVTKFSDERLKMNMTPIGNLGSTPLYAYTTPWDPTPQIGVSAQEAIKHYPDAITKGGDNPWTDPWRVNYASLLGSVTNSPKGLQSALNNSNAPDFMSALREFHSVSYPQPLPTQGQAPIPISPQFHPPQGGWMGQNQNQNQQPGRPGMGGGSGGGGFTPDIFSTIGYGPEVGGSGGESGGTDGGGSDADPGKES